MGRPIEISGADLEAESHKALEQAASEITAEYNRELNTEPAQLLYDSITDHSRNEVVSTEAVSHALKNVSVEFQQAN
jgi:phage-related minor tail protein